MDLRILGRIRSGSNAVFLAEEFPDDESTDSADAPSDTPRWVHKPVRGEAPLWDFPAGVLPPAAAVPGSAIEEQISGTLAAREVAAYRVSRAAGWDVVPETLAVVTAAGPGMAQRWLDLPDDEVAGHGRGGDVARGGEVEQGGDASVTEPVGLYAPKDLPSDVRGVVALETEDGDPLVLAHTTGPRVRRIALLDAVINNADRKAGHVLRDTAGLEWGIDHGLSFHVEPKVRSVLWGFAGTSFDDVELSALRSLRESLAGGPLALELGELLAAEEVEALVDRVEALLTDGEFPAPAVDFPLPWPLY